MEYTISKEGKWRTLVAVNVETEKVEPDLTKTYEEYQKSAKVEGFRKGKMPLALVKKMFGKTIESKVFTPHISEAWKKVFEENEFDVIDEPSIENIRFDKTKGLTFEIRFTVRPDIHVTGYDKMPVEKIVYEVNKDDVEATLESLRQRNAMIYNVEGEAKEDHYLFVDLQELDRTGVPVVGQKAEDQQIWLSKDDTELTPQLVGVKVGENRRITLKITREGTAANPIRDQEENRTYLVTVKDIKERRLPELDDEFAKDIGEFNTLSELRKQIDKNLKEQARVRSEYQLRTALEDELIKRMDFDVPDSMLIAYLDALVKEAKTQVKEKEKFDEKAVREQYKSLAIRNIKWMLVREKLIEQQGFEVTDQEIDSVLQSVHQDEQKSGAAEEIQNRRGAVKDRLLDDKVYDFLTKRADIKVNKQPWKKAQEQIAER